MKMKKLTEVYMNEAIDKNISIIKNEELNCYITFKHIIKASNCCINYINGNDVIIIDDGYSILEYSPIDKNYNLRIFIDNKGNILKLLF